VERESKTNRSGQHVTPLRDGSTGVEEHQDEKATRKGGDQRETRDWSTMGGRIEIGNYLVLKGKGGITGTARSRGK